MNLAPEAVPTDISDDWAFVDQGSTGEPAAAAAAEHGITLAGAMLDNAKRGFCWCPGAGWPNAALPERRGFSAWPRVASDCPPWRACILWRVHVRCCIACSSLPLNPERALRLEWTRGIPHLVPVPFAGRRTVAVTGR